MTIRIKLSIFKHHAIKVYGELKAHLCAFLALVSFTSLHSLKSWRSEKSHQTQVLKM